MKISCTLLALLTFISTNPLLAQEEGRLTEHVTKVTFIEPGIAHEFPVGKTMSFFFRAGMTATVAINYYDEFTGLLFRPFGSTTFRTYYNFARRNSQERKTKRNSANYVALLLIAATPPLNKGDDYNTDLDKALINTGVVWGMQRNYRSGFSLDLNIGLGYVQAGSTNGISLVSELNIGWWLGKKK